MPYLDTGIYEIRKRIQARLERDFRMAQDALNKLEEQLTCSICLEIYTDPKLLLCNHVCCRKCLIKLVFRDEQGELSLPCPTCRQITKPIPASGVSGLATAFHINHLLDIYNAFHKKVPDPVEVAGATKPNSMKMVSYCSEHREKELELYCDTCGRLICWKCTKSRGGKHHSHNYDEAFQQYEEEIKSSLEPMDKQLMSINEVLIQLDKQSGELADHQVAVEADIHNTMRRLREVLFARETSLIAQLHRITQGKLKELSVRKDRIETTQAQLSSCLEFMKESLKAGSRREVLKMKTTLDQQVRELTTTFQPEKLECWSENSVISFSASADLTAICQNFGQLLTQDSPDPSKCLATGKGLVVAPLGEMSRATFEAVNFNGQPCSLDPGRIDCSLVAEKAISVETQSIGYYGISYQPTIEGRHQLHIRIDGCHIKGSPFQVAVLSVATNRTPSLVLEGLNAPWGVARNSKGEFVVTEESAHCVSLFTPSGRKVKSFGGEGPGLGQFCSPRGVVVDGEGSILVIDCNNHRVQKFTASGRFVAAVGTMGIGNLRFHHPKDLARNPKNNRLYVVDDSNHIQVLNPDLTFFSSFAGQFVYPCGVACDSDGNVYVADSSSNSVQVFTAEGKLVRMFGEGELSMPIGVAIDVSGLVYVSEYISHRVSVFNSEGHFLTCFGQEGVGLGEFKCLGNVAVANGVLYVCDRNNHRVQSFIIH